MGEFFHASSVQMSCALRCPQQLISPFWLKPEVVFCKQSKKSTKQSEAALNSRENYKKWSVVQKNSCDKVFSDQRTFGQILDEVLLVRKCLFRADFEWFRNLSLLCLFSRLKQQLVRRWKGLAFSEVKVSSFQLDFTFFCDWVASFCRCVVELEPEHALIFKALSFLGL